MLYFFVLGEQMAGGAIEPHRFYFQLVEYEKPYKLSSRCHQHHFIKLIKDSDASEKKWFHGLP